jgi:CRISPR-associated protein Cmr3
MTASSRIGLVLEPLDVLFFRDGRPFSAASRLTSGLPMPQTFAGAVRTWLMHEHGWSVEEVLDAERLQTAGPWLWRDEEPLVPLPATLRWAEEGRTLVRLDPLGPNKELPGWDPAHSGLRPLWPQTWKPVNRASGYLTMDGLEEFLAGSVPDAAHVVSPDDLYGFERRTGIAIEPDRLVSDRGLIYAAGMLALKPGLAWYGEVVGPAEILGLFPEDPVPVPFGGEGRRTAMRKFDAFEWPSTAAREDQGTALALISPGLFDAGWKPGELQPIAAAVPGYEAVSGWDLARGGPKPTRFAAAAGSVNFLDKLQRSSTRSLCALEDAALGWGTYVEGVWSHA